MHPPTAIEVQDSCTIEVIISTARQACIFIPKTVSFAYLQVNKFVAQFPLHVFKMNQLADSIIVIWKILCKEDGKTTYLMHHSSDDEGCTFIREDSSSDDSNFDGATTYPDVPHTIVFKCIGASRDSQSQASLRTARGVIASGGTVPVRMRPEPTNIVDSRAIVFECEIEKKWRTIGYVVTEVLDHVHVAISSGSILSVNFKCIRYVTHWTVSGPGYYTVISVTKIGPWSRLVKRYQSTIR